MDQQDLSVRIFSADQIELFEKHYRRTKFIVVEVESCIGVIPVDRRWNHVNKAN